MVFDRFAGRGRRRGRILRVARAAKAVHVPDFGAGAGAHGFPVVGHAGRFGQQQSEIGRDAAADSEQVPPGTGDPTIRPVRQRYRCASYWSAE